MNETISINHQTKLNVRKTLCKELLIFIILTLIFLLLGILTSSIITNLSKKEIINDITYNHTISWTDEFGNHYTNSPLTDKNNDYIVKLNNKN